MASPSATCALTPSVIDHLLKNELFLRWFPIVAGVIFVSLFTSLGLWQLDRASEKVEMRALFETDKDFVEPSDYTALTQFDRIKVSGRYRDDRQVLIDNIPREGHLGYYVITPFEPSMSNEILLVNRGWLPKPASPTDDEADLTVDGNYRTIRGLTGHLPRVAIRPGEAFVERDAWPRLGFYPSNEEIAAEIEHDILPTVLLLHPEAENGFVRRWEPETSGPMTHYSYALQWLASAVAAACIAGRQVYKRYFSERSAT